MLRAGERPAACARLLECSSEAAGGGPHVTGGGRHVRRAGDGPARTWRRAEGPPAQRRAPPARRDLDLPPRRACLAPPARGLHSPHGWLCWRAKPAQAARGARRAAAPCRRSSRSARSRRNGPPGRVRLPAWLVTRPGPCVGVGRRGSFGVLCRPRACRGAAGEDASRHSTAEEETDATQGGEFRAPKSSWR